MNNLDFLKECDRLKSFRECHISGIDVNFLAKMGFYYDIAESKVMCKFCNLNFDSWKENYFNPVLFHRVYSPTCPIVTRQALRNEPIEVDDLTRICYEIEDIPNYDRGPNDCFTELDARLESFSDWPIGMQTRPEDLAPAGFYYSGRGDIVFCYVCGLKLNQWKVTDDAFVKHAKYSKDCAFLDATKGPDFIERVLQDEMDYLRNLERETMEEILQNDRCSVCYMRKRTMICVPCGHFLMCEPCSNSLTNCPLCGMVLSQKIAAIIL
ncbi:RING-type domain-containing protein [Sergentomyia squamirostris]